MKRDYEKLLTVDFVCHGVPSPGIFREMLEDEERRYKGSVKNITFREKNPNGRGEEYLYIYLDNGRRIEYKSLDFYYYYLFLYNCTLRSSCMDCARAENHHADLTLADDWLQKWQNDPKIGVSLIRVNTKKGKSIFESLQDELTMCPVKPSERIITVQAHHYDTKNREKTFRKYCSSHDVRALKKIFRQIKFHNESKKKLIYVLSKSYHTIVPRRKDNGN